MFSIVVAYDRNRVIGINNQLPWRLPADLAHVKRTTMGKVLIMGRKTFDSIGRALPGRVNIVLTKDKSWSHEGVQVFHTKEEIIRFAEQSDKECIIFGGQALFEMFMPYVSKIYLTYIDSEFEGDTYFPQVDFEEGWEQLSSVKGPKDEKNPYDYYFQEYRRMTPIS